MMIVPSPGVAWPCGVLLHFLQQRFLLLQQLGDLTFGGTPIGDIFECQENEIARIKVFTTHTQRSEALAVEHAKTRVKSAQAAQERQ